MRRFCFILSLLSPFFLQAEGTLTVWLSRHTITVGDPIEVRFTLTLPEKAQLKEEFPGGALLGSFEIKDYTIHPWKKKGDEKIQMQTYRISAFAVGTFFIQPYKGSYQFNGKEHPLTLPPIPIVVTSLAEENQTLQDIKDVEGIPPPFPYLLIAGLGAVFAIFGAGLWWWKKRRKKKSLEEPSPLPSHIVAWDALENLRQEKLLEKGEVKAYYVALTDIFKYYIGERFSLDTLDKTTRELLPLIKNLPLDRSYYQKIKAFLARSDLAKFAKVVPPEQKGREDFSLVESIVQETTPEEEAS